MDVKTYLTIQGAKSTKSGQYTVSGCLRWINEIQTKFNRVKLTRLQECILKDETSYICVTECWVVVIPLNLEKTGSTNTVQKMKLFIKDFFSKCDQIPRKLRIWSYLLKRSLMENFIFCAMEITDLAIKNYYGIKLSTTPVT